MATKPPTSIDPQIPIIWDLGDLTANGCPLDFFGGKKGFICWGDIPGSRLGTPAPFRTSAGSYLGGSYAVLLSAWNICNI